VANIRKNCFICEIVHIVRQVIDGFNNLIDLIHKFSAGEIRENLINAHRNDLREFLQQIEREHGNNDDISDEDKFEIRYIMDNLLIRPDYYFNGKYDKIRGDFGLRHFLFIPYHKESIIKNGKTYYYPNQRCEGYGFNVHCQDIDNNHFCCEDIFNPRSGQWCIAYSNLSKSRISYRMPNVQPEILYANNRGYRLLYQCKIKISEIISEQNYNITLRNDNKNYVIPYRLLKEYID
jgi:hypothetical protein